MSLYAITGHRPGTLGGFTDTILDRLDRFGIALVTHILQDDPQAEFVIGMALGFDQAVAKACVRMTAPFIAAVPYKDQDHIWRPSDQQVYRDLLTHAKRMEVVSPGEWSVRKLMIRNEWMVNQVKAQGEGIGAVLALYNGKGEGGTSKCVEYAEKAGVEVLNYWDQWEVWK